MPKSRKRPKKKAKPEDQHAQFVETARRLGADMDEETFKRAVGKIAKERPAMTVFYEDRKSEILSALRALAQTQPIRVKTYAEFGALFDPPIPAQGPWKGILDMIAKEEVADGRPDITFLVVNKKTGYPGQIEFDEAHPPSSAQKKRARDEFEKIAAYYGNGYLNRNPF